MRHSSWTLFLVPLALLLVLLLPGATKNTDATDPVVEARYEQVLGDNAPMGDASPASTSTSEETPSEESDGPVTG